VGEANVVVNRKVRHAYAIIESCECGIVLTGSEIKSIRDGNVSIQEAYGRIEGGVALLLGVTIGPYANARVNHLPQRPRRLLLHRREIDRFHGQLKIKGRTWVPTRLYFHRGWLKVEMAACIGKRHHDRRQEMKERDARREISREMSRRRG
jgi:SsrA-binding protein